jgi:hypothetical protein
MSSSTLTNTAIGHVFMNRLTVTTITFTCVAIACWTFAERLGRVLDVGLWTSVMTEVVLSRGGRVRRRGSFPEMVS